MLSEHCDICLGVRGSMGCCQYKSPRPTEAIHIKPAAVESCETHQWPTLGMAARLVTAMRERHGKGGINVCRTCIERARNDASAAQGDKVC